MARYKGCASAKIIERDLPHIVEIAVPPGGLGKRRDKMYDWHRARSIQDQRGSSRREEGRDFISWCFADSPTAETLAAEFDGKPLLQKSRLR